MKVLIGFCCALSASFVCCTAANAQSGSTPTAVVGETLRLANEQRYADSVAMSVEMKSVAPDDPVVLEAQGAVALEVGVPAVASVDFHDALVRNPSDAIALYGAALVELLAGRSDAALFDLLKINPAVLSPDTSGEVAVARAASLTQLGRFEEAEQVVSGNSDPAAAEITAIDLYRQDNDDTEALKTCLLQSLSNGIPTVVEPGGMRLLLAQAPKAPEIEPSIIDADTQQNMAQRFAALEGASAHTLSGTVQVHPPRSVPNGTFSARMTVDGSVVGETNAPPYEIGWDTSSLPNGSHELTFTLMDSSRRPIAIQDEFVTVDNASVPAVDIGATVPDLEDRTWEALRLKPDYKVVEYEYALAALRAHDSDSYETHILRAAALDPDYLDVRMRIHPLFIGQAPNTFPVPDGTRLPSSLGLSAGAASAAGFWAGSPHVRELALTFDDGPLPVPTAELLAALRTAGARASFFVVGMRAAESPDSLRQMSADGNSVEDHTYTHPNLTQILPQHILQEILRTAVIIQAATGQWPHFLRPPGGNTNPLVLETAKACGMSGAFWTIDALPAEESGSPDGVVKWVVSRARPGAIVLMHNGMDATIAAVPALVKELRQRGYKLVTIRQLAADALSNRHPGT